MIYLLVLAISLPFATRSAWATTVHHAIIARTHGESFEDTWVDSLKDLAGLEKAAQISSLTETGVRVPLMAPDDRTSLLGLVAQCLRGHRDDDLTLDLVVVGHGNPDGFVSADSILTPYRDFADGLKRLLREPRGGRLRLRIFSEACFSGIFANLFRRAPVEMLFVTNSHRTDAKFHALSRAVDQTLHVLRSSREFGLPSVENANLAREFELIYTLIGRFGYDESGDPGRARLVGGAAPRGDHSPAFARGVLSLYEKLLAQMMNRDGRMSSLQRAIEDAYGTDENSPLRGLIKAYRATSNDDTLKTAADILEMHAYIEAIPARQRRERIRLMFDHPDEIVRFAALDTLLVYRDMLPRVYQLLREFYWTESRRADASLVIRTKLVREIENLGAASPEKTRICQDFLTGSSVPQPEWAG